MTISFVPDGTLINGVASNMQSTFNTKFGSAATWQNVIKEAAQVWAAQTNINFNFVTDNGQDVGNGLNQQGDSGFGDIRIGGYNFGANVTTLAQAYMPPPVNNYSIAGDVVFNTGQNFNIGSAYNLFTVASHEIGHALGLNHGNVGAIMASSYPGTVTALQTDDINGIRAIYSGNAARSKDSYDAAATNNTFATASNVTSTIDLTSKASVIQSLDLSSSTDVDYYKFTVPSGSNTTLRVKAVATGLSLANVSVQILNANNTVVATGLGTGYGTTVNANFTGIAANQTYTIRVYSADAKAAFKTGAYALTLNMGTGADPAVSLPTTTLTNGTPKTSGGGVAFNNGIETQVNISSSSFSTGSNGTMAVDEMDGATASTSYVLSGQPVLAMNASGDHVVVWQSIGQDGSGGGIYAQRYNSSGIAQDSQFLVNTTTAGNQSAPAVAMEPNGDFTVAWVSEDQDGSGLGIYGQRFNANGTMAGTEFRVNTTTANDQVSPAIAYSNDGSFVIAWSSYGQDTAGSWGVYAQRYSSTGTVTGSEFLVNQTTAGDQITPVVGLDGNGSFGIGWSSYNQDTAGSWGAYYRGFSSSGTALFNERRLNATTAGDQRIESATMAADGSWLAVWTSSGQDGSGQGVYGVRFDTTGNVVGSEFRLNTTTAGDQTNPSATSDDYGNFYVTWQSYNQDGAGSWGIYSQQFSSTGTPIEGEFRVNSTTAGDQLNPAAAMDSQGHLVVVWNGAGIGGVADGVFMQRYSINTSLERTELAMHEYDPNGHDDDHESETGNGHDDDEIHGVYVGSESTDTAEFEPILLHDPAAYGVYSFAEIAPSSQRSIQRSLQFLPAVVHLMTETPTPPDSIPVDHAVRLKESSEEETDSLIGGEL